MTFTVACQGPPRSGTRLGRPARGSRRHTFWGCPICAVTPYCRAWLRTAPCPAVPPDGGLTLRRRCTIQVHKLHPRLPPEAEGLGRRTGISHDRIMVSWIAHCPRYRVPICRAASLLAPSAFARQSHAHGNFTRRPDMPRARDVCLSSSMAVHRSLRSDAATTSSIPRCTLRPGTDQDSARSPIETLRNCVTSSGHHTQPAYHRRTHGARPKCRA